jgi:hypothetical protein
MLGRDRRQDRREERQDDRSLGRRAGGGNRYQMRQKMVAIGEGRDKVAEASKKWFRLRDSYGLSINPGQDDVLILAAAVCIDEMAHGGR